MRRNRIGGATKRLSTIAPAVSPRAAAARITPTAAAPPCRFRASGVTTPSGAL